MPKLAGHMLNGQWFKRLCSQSGKIPASYILTRMIPWRNFMEIPYFQIPYVCALAKRRAFFLVSFAKKLPETDHETQSIQLHIQKQFLYFCTPENAKCYKAHTNTVQTKAEFSLDAISKHGTTREVKK